MADEKPMSDEAKKLYARLKVAQKKLREKKLDLERLRRYGEKLEQEVMSAKAEVHSIKDQLAALAGEE